MRSIGHIGRLSEIADSDAENIDAHAMLEELHADTLILISALKTAKRLADESGDNASSGIVDTWTDEAEQRAWFISASLS